MFFTNAAFVPEAKRIYTQELSTYISQNRLDRICQLRLLIYHFSYGRCKWPLLVQPTECQKALTPFSFVALKYFGLQIERFFISLHILVVNCNVKFAFSRSE
jgi:hypothetical protein